MGSRLSSPAKSSLSTDPHRVPGQHSYRAQDSCKPGCSQTAGLDGAKDIAAVPRAGCATPAGWDPHAWLPPVTVLAPAQQSEPAWPCLHLGTLHPTSPTLGKAFIPPEPGTHAPHSTFRERMLSNPHSMMFGQAEVNSILLPWKFSWSYTVIWNRKGTAQLGAAWQ